MTRDIIWLHNTDVIMAFKNIICIGRHVTILGWNKSEVNCSIFYILVVNEGMAWICYVNFLGINS
jgi:hypothetical protein